MLFDELTGQGVPDLGARGTYARLGAPCLRVVKEEAGARTRNNCAEPFALGCLRNRRRNGLK